MKISKKPVEAAKRFDTKTIIYRAPKEIVQKTLDDDNMWLGAAFRELGWESINMDELYGSRVIDDVLYILSTDGKYIENGDEDYDPEEILFKLPLEDLSEIILDADSKIIHNRISWYEMQFDTDKIGDVLMQDSNYSFSELVKAADEIGIIDKII